MDWQELIKVFNLDKKVEEFVKSQLANLLCDKHSFDFEGHEGRCQQCQQGVPHPPHVTGHYETPRHGWLEYFCMGHEGQINGSGLEKAGRLCIVTTTWRRGSALDPARAEGYWFVDKEDHE
jgi:hypothetical protein